MTNDSNNLSHTDQQAVRQKSIPTNNPIQAKPPISSSQSAKDNWKRLIWYAKKQWAELSEADLLKTEGDERKLTVLLKDRCTLKHDIAHQQVKTFFANNINR